MNTHNKKNKIIAKIFAWIGLIIIAIFIFVILYAMLTRNGQLALAFTIGLIFISIILWIGIKLYKSIKERENIKHNDKMNDITNVNTKNI